MLPNKTSLVLLAAVVAASGCGLSTYEEEMRHEEGRVDYLDEQDKLLGKPVAFSRKDTKEDDKSPAPPEVFLRLPKEVSNEGEPAVRGGLLYRFAGPSKTDHGFKDVYIAVTSDKKDFRPQVVTDMGPLLQYAGKPDYATKEIQQADGQTLSLETFSFSRTGEPPMKNYVYYYRQGKNQVIIIYSVADEKAVGRATVERTIQMSLETLAVGNAAQQRRQQFQSHPGG